MYLKGFSRIIVKIAALFIIAASSVYIFNFGSQDRGFPSFSINKKEDAGSYAGKVKKQVLPEKQGESVRTFEWTYGGKTFSISQTLYRSVYDFYSQAPKDYIYTGALPSNWEEDYYSMFLNPKEGDLTISELASNLKQLGEKNGFDSDEMIEFILAFVQEIEYDQTKADNILGELALERISYPYEVLFEKKGVCSDKSFLFVSLARELGYGTAVFVFNEEKHMAAAIKCPSEYSNYSSGYCYVETTSKGNKIGVIPEFDASINTVSSAQEVEYFDQKSGSKGSTEKLDNPEIFQKTPGNEYRGVIKTMATLKKIENMRYELDLSLTSLNSLKSDINENEAYLEKKKGSLEKYKEEGRIEKYNEIADKYNDALKEYIENYDEYSKKVSEYNTKVAEYNELVKKY